MLYASVISILYDILTTAFGVALGVAFGLLIYDKLKRR